MTIQEKAATTLEKKAIAREDKKRMPIVEGTLFIH